MKVYTFDRLTGEYIGSADADESPMEPGSFMVPAYATRKAPPAADATKVAVFDMAKDRWKSVALVVEPVPVAVKPKLADVAEDIRMVIRDYVHSYAVALDFDSIEEAMTYADEAAVPKYQMLARGLRAWRSLVWFEFDQLMARIKAGAKPPAGVDALIALLPKFVAPNTAELETVRSLAEDIPADVTAFMAAQAARLHEILEAARLAAEQAAEADAEPIPQPEPQPE